jgi:hypothetical protein
MTDEESAMRVPRNVTNWDIQQSCVRVPSSRSAWNLRIGGQFLGRLRVVLEVPGESDRILHIDHSQLDWFNKLRELRAHDLEAG